LSPVPNRTYYERIVSESKETDDSLSLLNFYANINFYLNESREYIPGEDYYELGYWDKNSQGVISNIAGKTYNKELKEIDAGEKYDPSMEYFYKKNYQ
jgi:hypothetical protein